MKLRRSRHESHTGYVGDHADKLSHIPPLAHDDDERPRREDMTYGETTSTGRPCRSPAS